MESKLEFKGVEITFLKHAGFMIKGSKVLYIDPFQIPEDAKLEKADLILVTHEHFDHMDMDAIKKLSKDDTVIVHPRGCIIRGYESCGIFVGQTVNIKGVEIKAIPAYNVNKPFHKEDCVGYIVTIDGVSIYHAGDTDRIPEMKEIEVDIALLPIGGTYTMDVKEAAEAAEDVKAEVYIPMHYNAIPKTEANPEEFRYKVPKAVILKPQFP